MPDRIDAVCGAVQAVDPRSARLSRIRQLTLARPIDSLGVLDQVVHRIAAVRAAVPAGPLPAVVSVLAGDHGVAERGTSVHRTEVTGNVLSLIDSGRAPVNILADRVPARVETANFGLHKPVGDLEYRVRGGTADICVRDAMSLSDARTAVANGIRYAEGRLKDAALVAIGEIGVGNTTATAALATRLLGATPADTVGAGSGVDDATIGRKRAIVEAALARTQAGGSDPMTLLAALGGYEIAGNVGVILAAAAARQVVVLDGYITGVAGLLAVRLCPAVVGYLIASHRSAERGHAGVLEALGLRPLLALDLRLGMASGAALALGLINSALAVATATPRADEVGLTALPRRDTTVAGP